MKAVSGPTHEFEKAGSLKSSFLHGQLPPFGCSGGALAVTGRRSLFEKKRFLQSCGSTSGQIQDKRKNALTLMVNFLLKVVFRCHFMSQNGGKGR